jgi:hypothetical protein
VVQGEGCSSCTGGLGSYTFTSATSGFANGYNSWRTKQVTTLPDGNSEIVYANFAGQAILSVFTDTATGLARDSSACDPPGLPSRDPY